MFTILPKYNTICTNRELFIGSNVFFVFNVMVIMVIFYYFIFDMSANLTSTLTLVALHFVFYESLFSLY